MNKVSILSVKYIFFISILFFAFSCSNDKEGLLNLDQEITSIEVKAIFEIDDLSSAADDVVTQIFQDDLAGKRYSKPYNSCYEVDYSDTGFTVVFTNCGLEGIENIINGSLTVTYMVGEETSDFTVIYANFMVDDIEINGTRTFTINNNNTNSVSFAIVSDMSIKLENGLLVQENGSKTLSILFNTENIANSGLAIEGIWTVKVDDDTYLIEVTSALQTNLNCPYIAKGAIDLNKNGLQVSIDFGDGTCDYIGELMYPDGTKEELSLKD